MTKEPIPEFSSQPILRKNGTKIKPEKTVTSGLSESLSAIYQNSNGTMPDMKNIIMKKSNPLFRFFISLLVIGTLMASAAWAGFFFWAGANSGSTDTVALHFEGPTTVASGAPLTVSVVIKNEQKNSIANTILTLSYPPGFVFSSSSLPAANIGHTEWRLGNLLPYEERTLSISGALFGSTSSDTPWRGTVQYRPSNFSSDLRQIATFSPTVIGAFSGLSVSGPDKITAGGEAEFILTLDQTTLDPNLPLDIFPRLPASFHLTSSTPALTPNGVWMIPPRISTSSPSNFPALIFRIRGTLGGNITESVTSSFALSQTALQGNRILLGTSEIRTRLIQNGAGLTMTVNGNTDNFSTIPGDTLTIVGHFKNTSTSTIKNATISLSFDAPAIQKQSLLGWNEITDPADGDIKGTQISDIRRTGSITWTSKHIPALATLKPNDDIAFTVKIPIRDSTKIDLSAVAENTITINTEASFVDKNNVKQNTIGSFLTVTLNSDTQFLTSQQTGNTAGLETRAIHWQILNHYHSLKNITITADVYGDVSFLLTRTPDIGTIAFDTKTKKITWEISDLVTQKDATDALFNLTLNKKNPTQATLISKPRIEATDAETNEPIHIFGEETKLLP